jgi:hypothetical protein
MPVQVNLIRNEIRMSLGTQGPNGPEDAVQRVYRWGNPWPRRPTRGRLVVDLDMPGVRAWMDGSDKAVEQILGPPLSKSDRFRGTVISPFNVAASSHSSISVGGLFSAPANADVGYYGLKVSDRPVYDLGWKRIVDSRPDNDLTRYFTLDDATVGFFGFDDTDDAISRRSIRVAGWWGTAGGVKGESTAYLLDDVGHRADNSGVHGGRIEGVEFVGGDARYGAGLKIGYANGMDLRDCAMLGGAHGIATSGAAGSVYPFNAQDIGLRGNHSGMAAWYLNWATIRNAYSQDGYDFAGFAFVNSDVQIDTYRTPEYGKPSFGLYYERSTGVLRNISLDSEEGPGSGSQVAHVYVSPPRGLVYQVSPFDVDRFTAAGIAPSASGILLGGKAEAAIGDAPLRVSNFAMHVNFPCRSAIRALPGAEGAWQDGGIYLPSKSGAKIPYEGGPLKQASRLISDPAPIPVPPQPAEERPRETIGPESDQGTRQGGHVGTVVLQRRHRPTRHRPPRRQTLARDPSGRERAGRLPVRQVRRFQLHRPCAGRRSRVGRRNRATHADGRIGHSGVGGHRPGPQDRVEHGQPLRRGPPRNRRTSERDHEGVRSQAEGRWDVIPMELLTDPLVIFMFLLNVAMGLVNYCDEGA